MSELAEALATLLTCRTVAASNAAAKPSVLTLRAPLRRRSRGAVDLALLEEGDTLPDKLRPTAVCSRGRLSTIQGPTLSLGQDGGLWRAGLAFGLGAVDPPPTARKGVVLLAQRTAIAEYLLAEAKQRGLPVLAAIATGTRRPRLWCDLVGALAGRAEVQVVIVALQQPTEADTLATAAVHAGPPLLMCNAPAARHLRAGSFGQLAERLPRLDELASALGCPAFATVGRAMEGAQLLLAGLRPRYGRVLGLVRHPDETAILQQSLGAAGLRPRPLEGARSAGLQSSGPFLLSPSRQHLLTRALRRAGALPFDALLCAGRVPRTVDLDVPQFFVGPRTPTAPARLLDETTLAALGTLLDALPAAGKAPIVPAPESPRLGEDPLLGEAEARALAAGCGISPLDGRLVGSASAAAKVVSELEPPLTVRATGPTLALLEGEARAAVRREGLASAAAARQAFRDVLFACAEHYPDEPLEGVIVAEEPPPGLTLDALLLFPADVPVVRLQLAHKVVLLRSPATAAQQDHSARDLLSGRGKTMTGALDAIARLLRQLDDLAQQQMGRLRWMHLGPLHLGTNGTTRLVAARGERRWPERKRGERVATTR